MERTAYQNDLAQLNNLAHFLERYPITPQSIDAYQNIQDLVQQNGFQFADEGFAAGVAGEYFFDEFYFH